MMTLQRNRCKSKTTDFPDYVGAVQKRNIQYFVSSELEELVEVCHRILIMHMGKKSLEKCVWTTMLP